MVEPQSAGATPPTGPTPQGLLPTPGRVHAAMLLLAAVAVLEVVGFAVAFRMDGSELAEHIPPEFPPELVDQLERQVTVFGVGVSVLWLVVWAVFLALAWQGRPWARIAVTVLAVGTAFGVTSLSPNWIVATVLEVVLSGLALYLLWWGSSTAWYRSRNARR